MRVADLSPAMLAGRLDAGQLLLPMGPFVARLRSPLPSLAKDLASAYRDHELVAHDSFADFHISLHPARGPGHWLQPKACFYLDGAAAPVSSGSAAITVLEQGLDWCVAHQVQPFLVLRAAVVERGGCALLLAGPPGSGKSTLCAALVQQGWRLLSDALALLDFDSGLVSGMVRPIGLRNGAIPALRRFAPSIGLTPERTDSAHGTVAMVPPPASSLARMHEPAWPTWLVQAHYTPAAGATLRAHGSAASFMQLAREAVNYRQHGRRSFEALGDLIDQCSCHQLHFGALDAAVQAIDALTARAPCPADRAC